MTSDPLAWRLRVLWWRMSLPFRFAHKPLCERFEDHVWQLGELHLCRSCTLVYGAAAMTLALGAALGLDAAPVALAIVPPTVVGSIPQLYARLPRPLCEALRASLGVSIALCMRWAWSTPAVGLVALLTLGLAAVVLQRMRAAGAASACQGCPHDGQAGVCPGFEQQAQRARRYEAAASELVMLTKGPAPSVRRPSRTLSPR